MNVDAGPVARRYHLVDGRPRTAALAVDGVEVAVEAATEVAVVVDGRRWTDTDLVASDVVEAPGGAALSWTLRGDGVEVRMVVEADRGAGVVRKRAEVAGRGRLSAVELERWTGPACTGNERTGEPVAYNAGAVGLGQPVFGPGFFAGIEHPVAENLVGRRRRGDGCTCTLPLAVDLGPAPHPTPASVVGGGGRDAFWDYVDTFRPVPARLVTLTNNWYHLGATGLMDEATVAAEVAGFAAVSARHGIDFDFAVLDDGWDGEWDDASGIWGRMAPSKFPNGIRPLGPGVGLWLSPFGGYGERCAARVAWAEAHGLEVQRSAAGLCPAGARYRAQLARALVDWTEAGVAYWKLDGVRFTCDDPSHGHPVGPGARTAQVDAFLGLVAGIRAARPDAVVAFTIGSHPSPWWLGAVDFVWRGGLDDTAAEQPGSRLDRFDTYIDCCLAAYRAAAFPTSALVAFSMVESAAASYRDPGANLDAWARHCWLAVGRGTLHHDLYVEPDSLSAAEWDVLAGALGWARANQALLARSRMILGDPGKGEVYGFAARRAGSATAIACLRNPSARPQTVTVDWGELAGSAPGDRVVVDRQYGRAGIDGGRVTLAPLDVLVVTVRWRR